MAKKIKREKTAPENSAAVNLGGIFGGFTNLLEKLGELAETGEELRRSGEFASPGKDFKVVYGFTAKVGGLAGQTPKVELFGNIHKDKASGQTVVDEIREPVADVFEEKDYINVIVEMPGIGSDDVKLEVQDDVLVLNAEKEDKKYHKEILLPCRIEKSKVRLSCNNGIFEIKCPRAGR